MMKAMNSFALQPLLDILLDIVRFPLWWYTGGAANAGRWYGAKLRDGADALALVILLKNFDRPMYGDYSREGRIISFFVRLVQLAVSFVLYAAWFSFVTTGFLIWFLMLPAFVWFIGYVSAYG